MKSNLGMYQFMTTASKKMGGPVQFLTCTGLVGYGLFRAVEFGVTRACTYIQRHMSKENEASTHPTATVRVTSETNGGIALKEGEVIRILAQDGDAVLIEIPEATSNPYCVSGDWLRAISDYGSLSNAKTA